MNALFGLEVHVTPTLPIVPSDGENARRIVRHGMADILRWLGEKPGPKPGEETHAMMRADDLLFVSRELLERLRLEVDPWTYQARPGADSLEVMWQARAQWLVNQPTSWHTGSIF